MLRHPKKKTDPRKITGGDVLSQGSSHSRGSGATGTVPGAVPSLLQSDQFPVAGSNPVKRSEP
jgi:hypothetical protein